jgi:dTDP-4-amino-4,6-dideoxygalactose transaminase
MIKLVDLKAQHLSLSQEIWSAIEKIEETSSFINGEEVGNFERDFADFCRSTFAIGVSNGTSALEIALRCAGIGPGHEVITVANTFFATAEAIYGVGATPIFVDVDLDSGSISTSNVEANISSRTRAIVPVHLFGHLADMPRIREIADSHNLVVIEDAAQAHGAEADWGGPASLSKAAAFSFFPGKNLGGWGDAGAVITNDGDFAERIKKFKDHGRVSKYEHDEIGTNARLDTLQAAILRVKLTKLSDWNNVRQNLALKYISKLETEGFKILKPRNGSSWHLFPIRVANRVEVMEQLRNFGIETGIHYPVPLHKQIAIQRYYRTLRLENTELLAGQIVSLPLHPYLSENEVDGVIERFLEVAEAIC